MTAYTQSSYQLRLTPSLLLRGWMPTFVGMTTLLLSFAVHAAEWKIIPQESSIESTATYGKDSIVGTFPEFGGEILFDPKAPEKSRISITVKMDKIASEDKDAKTYLPMAEWFAAKEFPESQFIVEDVRAVAQNQYEAHGTLRIRDKTLAITLPFTLDIKNGNDQDAGKQFATVNASTTIKRLDFGVGQGDWSATDVIANDVSLKIHLDAVSQ